MGPQTARETDEPAVSLHMVAEAEIRRSGFRLEFPPELESRYRLDRATGWSHELRAKARIALALFLTVGILVNLFSRSEAGLDRLSVFWGLMIAVMLLVQPYFRPATPFLSRDVAVFGFCATLCLSDIAMVWLEPAPLLLGSFVFAALSISFIIIFDAATLSRSPRCSRA